MTAAVATAFLILGALAACSSQQEPRGELAGDWEGILSAAKKEGTVTVYSVAFSEENKRIEKAFATKYPEIKLELHRIGGPEAEPRLETERSTGTAGADVAMQTMYPWVQKNHADGEFADLVGPEFTKGFWSTSDQFQEDYFTASFPVYGVACNTNQVSEEECPDSWDEVAAGKFNGSLGSIDSPAAPFVDYWMRFLKDEVGDAGLTAIAEQKPVFFASGAPAEQGLLSGEISVLAPAPATIVSSAGEGAPVTFNADDAIWSPPIFAFVPSWAKHPNAGQVFANFLASKEGQEALNLNAESARDDVTGTPASSDNLSALDITVSTQDWADKNYPEFQKLMGR